MYVIQSRPSWSDTWSDTRYAFMDKEDAVRSLEHHRNGKVFVSYRLVLRTDEVMDA